MKKSTKVLLVTLAAAGALVHAGVRVEFLLKECCKVVSGSSDYGVMHPDEDFDWDPVWD